MWNLLSLVVKACVIDFLMSMLTLLTCCDFKVPLQLEPAVVHILRRLHYLFMSLSLRLLKSKLVCICLFMGYLWCYAFFASYIVSPWPYNCSVLFSDFPVFFLAVVIALCSVQAISCIGACMHISLMAGTWGFSLVVYPSLQIGILYLRSNRLSCSSQPSVWFCGAPLVKFLLPVQQSSMFVEI